LVIALVVVAAVAAVTLLPVNRWLLALIEWIRGAGALGVSVYSFAYIFAAVLLLPGSILTIGAGFAYGPIFGTLLVSPVSVLAATLAFLLGRSVARDWISSRVAGNRKFAAIDEAVGKSGFKIVLLLRLSPIFPYNMLNYALGLTRVQLQHFLLASWIGMLPGTLLYVYLGSLVTSVAELLGGKRPEAGPWGSILFFGGLAATVAVTVIITRIARRALKRALDENAQRPEPTRKEVHP
jgi:uncharacterized membrane protein YdjX (TVP38/TMEM64 family)